MEATEHDITFLFSVGLCLRFGLRSKSRSAICVSKKLVFVAYFNNDSITVSLKLLRLYNCSVELSHRLASCELSSQGTADIVPQESDDILKVNNWDKNINNNCKMVLLC